MSEYIDKKALLDEICRDNCERSYDGTCHNCRMTETIADFPAADVAPVVRCKDCKHSTLPSKLTQLYGETGTLTCRFGPCNRRNVNENDFCSYAERKDGGTE